jgi:phosphatidylglycerol:prolipoprotein diacylglycerol transferase
MVLNWFGITIVLAALAGMQCTAMLARRQAYDPEHVWRAMLWIAPLAVIGARLWFVFFPPQSVIATGRTPEWLLTHFSDLNQGAVAVWSGGLGLIGGLMGGLIGLSLYARHHRLPLRAWLDITVIGLALAQAIGLWGVGAAQEIYGPPTSLPWGMLINDVAHRVGPYTDLSRYPLDSTRFHPVWLYESILAAAIFGVLLVAFGRWRARLGPGGLALLYLLLYSGGRCVLEFMRVNVPLVGGLNISQMVMAGCAALAGALLWRMTQSHDNRPNSGDEKV